MNVLLVPIGSHGDVHPFIGIGLALRARGHRVKVLVNPFFGSIVEQAGLELVSLGTADEYREMAGDPDLWKPVRGSQVIFGHLARLARPVYEAVLSHHVPGQTVVAASTLALGARVAQDRHQIPTATIHLQPSVLRSYVDPPTMPWMIAGPRVPRWLMQLQWGIVDTLVVDRMAGPGINAFRSEVGLPKVKRLLRDFIHSPQLTIGLFPSWFAAPQLDWPSQVRVTGFPLYDERGVTALSPELGAFLDEGDPPIAFTFGSAMWHARELLEQSARACALLGRRGILLTRHRENLPQRLPDGVKHVDYAPFSELLPRCFALVHHGGIGTASQALAAGVPQAVLPHAHDQLDNATRLSRLGVARTLKLKRYKAGHVAEALGDLLGSPAVAASCRLVKERFAGTDAMGETCGLIEELALRETRNPNGE